MPCLIIGVIGKTYSFEEMELISHKATTNFVNLGLQQVELIMLLLQNFIKFAFMFIGESIREAIMTMANPFYRPSKITK